MRKSLVIVSLIALLLFVFPVAANANPPDFNEDEDGWVTVLSDFAEQVTNWYTEVFQSSTGPETSQTGHVSTELQAEVMVERLNTLLQAIRYNLLGD